MELPRELAEKLERAEACEQEAASIMDEVRTWLYQNTDTDGAAIGGIYLTPTASGSPQDSEDEFCTQSSSCAEDHFEGTYYHKLEGAKGFLAYHFEW